MVKWNDSPTMSAQDSTLKNGEDKTRGCFSLDKDTINHVIRGVKCCSGGIGEVW